MADTYLGVSRLFGLHPFNHAHADCQDFRESSIGVPAECGLAYTLSLVDHPLAWAGGGGSPCSHLSTPAGGGGGRIPKLKPFEQHALRDGRARPQLAFSGLKLNGRSESA